MFERQVRTGRTRTRFAAAVIATGVVAFAAGGCALGAPYSGGSPTTSAGSGGTGSSGSEAFSSCMRSHGVPGFPDLKAGPTTMSSRNGTITVNGQIIHVSGTVFQAAQNACVKDLGRGRPLSPQQAAMVKQQALRMAACMRAHGIPNFPDPTVHGGSISLHITKAMGIDPNSPVFQAAQKACPIGPPPGAQQSAGVR